MFERVAIVGVGLIGASFALALRKAGCAGEILGVSSPETVRKALDRGVIDRAATLEEAAAQADLIYLAQPVSRILEQIPLLAPHLRPDALVTDAGSTKQAIVRTAARTLPRGQFLGGHPMAGKASRGIESADADLFAGRMYLLTPEDPVGEPSERERRLMTCVEKIFSRNFRLTPQEHDRLVAHTSHLPQLLSTALSVTVREETEASKALKTAGPGLLDMTRLSQSSYDIWRDILMTNEDEIFDALNSYIRTLEYIKNNLQSEQLHSIFDLAASFSRSLRDRD